MSRIPPLITHSQTTLTCGNFRHEARQIYTYIGDVCVSVNPYTPLDIYGTDYVNQYKGEECAPCTHAESHQAQRPKCSNAILLINNAEQFKALNTINQHNGKLIGEF